jgi:cutinase
MRRRIGTRRRIALTVGVTATIILGGAMAAPFASASEVPSSRAGVRDGGALQRWLDFWRNRAGEGGGVDPGTGTGTQPGTGDGGETGGGDTGGGETGGGQQAAGCTDVHFVFARGTGEPQGLGSVGGLLDRALKGAVGSRSYSSYAVVYAAAGDQRSAGPGATDMSNHIKEIAAKCATTKFVIGGYSQGASVTDIAIGLRVGTTTGTAIPTNLAPRVAAVVVYGNPLGIGRRTIETASQLYGPKAKSFCAQGDPVCGGGGNFAAHLSYLSNGDVTTGAQFAAGKL